MAEGGEERTEKPTAKKLQEARRKGQVARSAELTSAVGLTAAMGVLTFAGPAMLDRMRGMLIDGLQGAGTSREMTPEAVMAVATQLGFAALLAVVPVAVAMALVGIVIGGAQTRFNFATGALKPDFKKLNPVKGAKQIFGLQGVFELVKNAVKLAVIAAVAYLVIHSQITELGTMTGLPAEEILPVTAGLVKKLGFSVAGCYLAIALADFAYQKYNTTKQLKMTKYEVRKEMKQGELSGEVKHAIKRRQMEAARRRMMQAVPDADVVITNPTHYAVALAYNADDPAPKVVAKGTDHLAAQIRATADEHDVPIMRDPPLARAVYAACDIDHYVPEELFQGVAQVLAYVYSLKKRR